MPAVESLLGALLGTPDFVRQPRVGTAVAPRREPPDATRSLDRAAGGLVSALLHVRTSAQRLLAANPRSVLASGERSEVSTTRPGAVTAEVLEGGERASSRLFAVKVSNLAVAQRNQGSSLVADDVTSLQTGTSTFALGVGTAAERTVSFFVASTDTNAEALEKLADAINAEDAGVAAEVVRDTAAGTVRLDVVADSTGRASAFTLADATGNAVAATGAGTTATAAEDAQFVVNGVAGSSSSNAILVDGGRVRLTLAAETGASGAEAEAPVVVAVGADPLAEAALDLVDAVNHLRNFLAAEGSAYATQTLRTVDRLLGGQAEALGALGVTVERDGRLAADPTQLETAIAGDSEAVEQALGGTGGVAAGLAAATDAALAGTFAGGLVERLLGPTGGLASGLTPDRGLLVDVRG